MLKVLRLDISGYQKKDFSAREKALVESLGLNYISHPDPLTEILISNSNTEFHKICPSDFPNLKLVIHPNSGYDNITLNWAQSHAPIIVGHEIRMNAVIEYSLSCLYSHFAKPPFVKSWDKGRAWERKLLRDSNVQLIGLGHIGRILEESLKPIVKNIFVFDPYKGRTELYPEKSNIVILAASLNPSSEKIINENFLKALPTDALIINGARGRLVDQEALRLFLTNHSEAFAYLDVFENEPCDLTPLSQLANTKLSSHVAGVYSALDEAILSFEGKILKDFMNDPLEKFKKKYANENLQNRIHKNYIL